MAKQKAVVESEAPPWGYEWFTAPDGTKMLGRCSASTYRALLADLAQGESVTLTGDRLNVARRAARAALDFEEIKERDWRMMRALNGPGSEVSRLRAMKREFLGKDNQTRGPVIDIAAVKRDWRLMTDPAPLIDADGCTRIMAHSLGQFGLVPECSRHGRPVRPARNRRAARERGLCASCREWVTPATATAIAKLAQRQQIAPRILVIRALSFAHGIASEGAAVQVLKRAGVRGLPALSQR
jgi:hypothetical protein